MLHAQRDYGSTPPRLDSVAGAAFGLSLFDTLPEDAFDRQPLSFAGGLMVADIRLDNRDALIADLGIDLLTSRQSADSEILRLAWRKWGAQCLRRIVGDFAIAFFSGDERKLTLARDPTGQRPLFFVQTAKAIAFASTPRGLLAVPGLWQGFNLNRLVESLLDLPAEGEETHFNGICRVPPGQMITFGAGHRATQSIWNPEPGLLRLDDPEAYVEAYRAVIDSAVKSRLRRRVGSVATHLSSGLDSSAVAGTAAMLLGADNKPIAFTSAPRSGFIAPTPRNRVADEADAAALTAKMHHMKQIVMRSAGSALAHVARQSKFYQDPHRNIINFGWLSAISLAARAQGASVILTGEFGNLTLNAGGLPILGDLVRRREWKKWWQEARFSARRADVRWRGILMNSFGWRLPRAITLPIQHLFLNQQRGSELTFLKSHWAEQALARRHGADLADPTGDSYADRLNIIRSLDFGLMNKGLLAESGVETRNPLADRRIIEFSLSLPHEQLLFRGVSRPLARRALADRVPRAILDSTVRGYQSADWFEHIGQQEVRDLADEIATSATARDLLDFKKIDRAIDDWPEENFHHFDVIGKYANLLPLTLATGLFVLEIEQAVKETAYAQ